MSTNEIKRVPFSRTSERFKEIAVLLLEWLWKARLRSAADEIWIWLAADYWRIVKKLVKISKM